MIYTTELFYNDCIEWMSIKHRYVFVMILEHFVKLKAFHEILGNSKTEKPAHLLCIINNVSTILMMIMLKLLLIVKQCVTMPSRRLTIYQ